MKILVIDNSIQTLKTITVILKNIMSDVRVVEMSNSCDTALEKIKQMQYDLIMVNVRLKGKDGFEIAQRLKKEGQGFYFVMYGDTETTEIYRKCMELQTLDYLVKPIEAKGLSVMLEKYYIRKMEDRNAFQSNREAIVRQSMDLIEFSFINSTLYSEHHNCDWGKYQYLLNINNCGYVLFLDPEVKTKLPIADYNLFSYYIQKGVSVGRRSIIGWENDGRVVIFVMVKYGVVGNETSSWEERRRYASFVKKTYYEIFHMKALVGVGEDKPINELRVSYEEALRAVRYGGIDAVQDSSYKEKEKDEKTKNQLFYELEEQFFSSVREGNYDALNQLSVLLDLMKNMDFYEKKSRIFEIVLISAYLSQHDGKNRTEYMNYSQVFRQIEFLQESDADLWILRYISNLLFCVRSYQDSMSADISKAVRYMEAHYSEDIFMEDVAAVLNISPQYFSRIFKERTGMTYVDYLTGIRIKKAKEWLSCSQNNIQEICFKVGYKDPNYFSRVFKKIVGITPKQYKSRKAEAISTSI